MQTEANAKGKDGTNMDGGSRVLDRAGEKGMLCLHWRTLAQVRRGHAGMC